MENGTFLELCGSSFWDLNLTWNTDSPQLTPCFEKTVLVWFPAAFLWVFSIINTCHKSSSAVRPIPFNWRNIGKLVIVILLVAICIVEFVNSFVYSEKVFLVDFYNPIIKLVSMVMCGLLVLFHRNYGQRFSDVLFLYWLLEVSSGIVPFYSNLKIIKFEEIKVQDIVHLLYYCLCVIMFFLHWILDLPPTQFEYAEMEKSSPEKSALFPSKVTFSWFDSMVWTGYKRPLVNCDLWPLNYEDTSAEAFSSFSKHWNQMYNKKTNVGIGAVNTTRRKLSILPVLFRAFGMTYFIGSILELFEILLTFLNPLLLRYMINFVEGDEPNWHGYCYALLLLLATTLGTLFQNQYMRLMTILGIRIKSSLISAIYRKALRLSNSARAESTVGEMDVLISEDAENFLHAVYFLSTLWSAPLQIAITLIFLWQILGPCVLIGLAVMVIVMPINGFLAKITEDLQSKLMEKTSKRAKVMNEILSGIKVLKLYAWEPSFEQRVLKIRGKEISILKKSAYFKALSSFIFSCTPFLISLLTFSTYVLIDESNVLDSSKVFVSLSLFSMLDYPLSMVKNTISTMIEMSVSVRRINKFLNKEELDPTVVSHEDGKGDSLIVENGTFSWGLEDNPTLENINLRVKEGSLVAVVGVVGAGKSSFVSAFLGEMYKISGRVNTKGSIAYVPQLAWIQNCTLRDNILFNKHFNTTPYQKVIDACALKPDLEILPGGDQTEIGEKGINLSGGQKQRVSLARAVYSDCDIYFLDDPLSAVDIHVGNHIFQNVIGNEGILKKKTRVFVTHNATYLREVDVIVVIKDKTISEIGTYQELLDRNGGAFSDFLKTYSEKPAENSDGFKSEVEKRLGTGDQQIRRQTSQHGTVNRLTSSVISKRERKISEPPEERIKLKLKPKIEAETGRKLIEEESVEVGSAKWSVYSSYLRAFGIALFAFAIFLTIANEALVISASFWLSIWSDDKDAIVNGTQVASKRDKYLEVFGLLGFSETVATFSLTVCWCIGTLNAAKSLHLLLLKNIFRSPLSFFDTTPQGRILNRFTNDIEVLDGRIPYVMKELFSYLANVLGILIVVSWLIPIFMTVIIPIGLLYYFIQRFYINTSLQITRLESIAESPVYSHFGESISGSSVIRAYQSQKRFVEGLEQKVDFNQSCSYSSIIAGLWLAVRLQMIGNLIIFFAALFGVASKDSLSPGIIGLCISYTLQITDALDMLMYYAVEVQSDIVAVERVKEYSNIPQEAPWTMTPSPVSSDWPQEGKVEFVDYKVRYREGLDLALRGLNFTIQGGEKIGIVGRTGAGKSSVTLSLFRIIESADGMIRIDDTDISKLGLHTLRSRLTIIPQDPVLFSGSMRMNLDPFDRHRDDRLWEALEHAHLQPFVRELPAQLQHKVTEGGENLSVGQRQLVCLARALLNKTKILILDEATAAIDLETDDFIQKTIRQEFADCTVLTIAHRINTIMDSDKVLVLDQGEVVEFDAPSVLLMNSSSIFYRMAHDARLV